MGISDNQGAKAISFPFSDLFSFLPWDYCVAVVVFGAKSCARSRRSGWVGHNIFLLLASAPSSPFEKVTMNVRLRYPSAPANFSSSLP